MKLKLPVRQIGDVDRVALADCILQGMTPEDIGDGLIQLVDARKQPRIVINLEDVNALSSSTLGVLLTLAKRVDLKGGRLAISAVSMKLDAIFHVTKLDDVLLLYPDDSTALASFSQ